MEHSEQDISHAQLGITQTPFTLDTSKALKLATQSMFSQAKRHIDIFSPLLDPYILNDLQFETLLSKMIRQSKDAQIRCLVYDVSALQKVDHCFIRLAQNLSSYTHIRTLPKNLQHHAHAFYLVDRAGIIYRRYASQYDSELCFNNPLKVKEKQHWFNELWEQGEIASELRRLHL